MHQAGFALAKPGHAAVWVLHVGVEIIRVHVRPRDRNDELGLSRNVTLFFCLGIHRQQRDDETKNKGNENIEEHVVEGVDLPFATLLAQTHAGS